MKRKADKEKNIFYTIIYIRNTWDAMLVFDVARSLIGVHAKWSSKVCMKIDLAVFERAHISRMFHFSGMRSKIKIKVSRCKKEMQFTRGLRL